MQRRRARAAVVAALFEWDVGGGDARVALERQLAEQALGQDASAFARELLDGVLGRRPELDRELGRLAVDWPVERMAAVDRNILRLGAYELLYRPDVPLNVAINEAVELAKRLGGPDSRRFVNGILGRLARERRPEAQAAPDGGGRR